MVVHLIQQKSFSASPQVRDLSEWGYVRFWVQKIFKNIIFRVVPSGIYSLFFCASSMQLPFEGIIKSH